MLGPVVDSVLREGETLKLTKLSAVSTSRDLDAGYLEFDQMEALLAETINSGERVYLENKAQWARLWKRAGVSIVGDETAQKAVNFSIYHLLRSVNPDDSRVAVCAKGYSGEAYFGHFFWDTEVYLLPFICIPIRGWQKAGGVPHSDLARRHGERQGLRISSARYLGNLLFPVRSSAPIGSTRIMRSTFTADVVHGIWHYYQAAGDMEFLKNALPVLKETARYWLARVCRKPGGAVTLDALWGRMNISACAIITPIPTSWRPQPGNYRLGFGTVRRSSGARFYRRSAGDGSGPYESVDWSGVIPQCDHLRY